MAKSVTTKVMTILRIMMMGGGGEREIYMQLDRGERKKDGKRAEIRSDK